MWMRIEEIKIWMGIKLSLAAVTAVMAMISGLVLDVIIGCDGCD